MKILLRTLIILAAALLVVAGLNAFARSAAGEAMRGAEPGRGAFGREGGPPPGLADRPFGGEAPAGFPGRGGHGGHGPSLLGLVEVGKNLAIVAVSVALIALGARLLRPRRSEGGPSSA